MSLRSSRTNLGLFSKGVNHFCSTALEGDGTCPEGISWSTTCLRYVSLVRSNPFLPSGNSDAAHEILKPRIASEGVQSGIHPDPWYSS